MQIEVNKLLGGEGDLTALEPRCPVAVDGVPCGGVLSTEMPEPASKLGRLIPATPEQQEQVLRFLEKNTKIVPGRASVFRVVNRPLELMFEQCCARFQSMGDEEVQLVYHGTTRQASGSIIKNGFDASFGGKAHGQVHGQGIYTARDANMSWGYTKLDIEGGRRMFICLGAGGRGHRRGTDDILVFPREQQVLPRWVIDLR